MANQVVAVMEALPTDITRIGALPAVGALVAGQVRLTKKAAVTISAGVWPICRVLRPSTGNTQEEVG